MGSEQLTSSDPGGLSAWVTHNHSTTSGLVLWDGQCGLCRRAAGWAASRDRHGRLSFLPYQQVPTPPMTAALAQACSRAVHVVTVDGKTLRSGRATLFVLSQLGWPITSRLAQLPPLRWLVELGYWLVARNRRLISRIL